MGSEVSVSVSVFCLVLFIDVSWLECTFLRINFKSNFAIMRCLFGIVCFYFAIFGARDTHNIVVTVYSGFQIH